MPLCSPPFIDDKRSTIKYRFLVIYIHTRERGVFCELARVGSSVGFFIYLNVSLELIPNMVAFSSSFFLFATLKSKTYLLSDLNRSRYVCMFYVCVYVCVCVCGCSTFVYMNMNSLEVLTLSVLLHLDVLLYISAS